MNLPKFVEMIEVCPRDGFQNIHDLIPFDTKVAVIKQLAAAGYQRIEICSFVSPKAIPQMADAVDVVASTREMLKSNGVKTAALVPNARGVETAVTCGIDELTYVISVSEKHNMANVKRTPAESMEEFKALIGQYGDKVRFRLSLATALGCPFGEEIRTERVLEMARFGFELGCEEVMIADTVGMANPVRVSALMTALVHAYGPDKFIMHLHDTRGLALANTLAAMQLGLHKFESAAGGLGGCPFAPGAAGNVASEDVLNMLTEMGVETGVDAGALNEAVILIQEGVHAPIVSHMAGLYKKPSCV